MHFRSTNRLFRLLSPPRPAVATHHHRMLSSKSSSNPWLSDKSVYPLLGICGVTFLFGLWFGPYWTYKSPEEKVNLGRRHNSMAPKKSHEHIPINENIYKKSQQLTNSIYRVTVKGKEEGK